MASPHNLVDMSDEELWLFASDLASTHDAGAVRAVQAELEDRFWRELLNEDGSRRTKIADCVNTIDEWYGRRF